MDWAARDPRSPVRIRQDTKQYSASFTGFIISFIFTLHFSKANHTFPKTHPKQIYNCFLGFFFIAFLPRQTAHFLKPTQKGQGRRSFAAAPAGQQGQKSPHRPIDAGADLGSTHVPVPHGVFRNPSRQADGRKRSLP